jgi:hypothetical protein
MYDKYFTATSFATTGTKLIKHKGILFANTSGTAGLTATLQLFNTSGSTSNVIVPVPANSTEILPIQAYSVSSIASGLTAWLLN